MLKTEALSSPRVSTTTVSAYNFDFLSLPSSTTCATVRSSSQNVFPPFSRGIFRGSPGVSSGTMKRDLWFLRGQSATPDMGEAHGRRSCSLCILERVLADVDEHQVASAVGNPGSGSLELDEVLRPEHARSVLENEWLGSSRRAVVTGRYPEGLLLLLSLADCQPKSKYEI
jgi:hypothetical protein